MSAFAESVVKYAALAWIAELGFGVLHGPDIDPESDAPERAKMRVMVKRILRKHGYPPDKQEKATQTVLEQAELMAEGLAA